MNPLTLVKRIQKITSTEAALGISDDASWHAKYKESAYVYIGGIPFDLTEGDLLAVFAQYGEIVDLNLVRDKGTGKSKGFAFLAYEDQRSTTLAVDNLNGAKLLGRIIRVDHVSHYKKKEDDGDEEKEQQKREARGVCHAFQRGECNRGATCKFSHDEQRNRNTGWGDKDKNSRWDHDKHNHDLPNSQGRSFPVNNSAHSAHAPRQEEVGTKSKPDKCDETSRRRPKHDDEKLDSKYNRSKSTDEVRREKDRGMKDNNRTGATKNWDEEEMHKRSRHVDHEKRTEYDNNSSLSHRSVRDDRRHHRKDR